MDAFQSRRFRSRSFTTLATAGLLALAGLGCGESSRPGADEPSEAEPAAVAIPALTLLNRPRQERDVIPRQIARQPIMRGALDLDSARLTRGLGRMTWLARSADGSSVCVAASGALACSSLDVLAQRGFGPSVSWRRGEPVRIAGIATDGVEHVDVTLANGRVRRVAVAGNALTLMLPATPRKLSWDGPNGREEQSLENAGGPRRPPERSSRSG